MNRVRLEEITPDILANILKTRPIVYIPWGALEWHGEHLPLGQDALKVEKICELIAKNIGGVVHPPIYIGHQTMQIYGMPYTLEYSGELVKKLAIELLQQLERNGFKIIVILMGHYGKNHVKIIKEAIKEYFLKGGKCKIIAEPEYVFAEDLGYHGDHAAKWETSIFWYLYPSLIHIEKLPKDISIKLKGVWGEDPRIYASKEIGEKVVRIIVRRISEKIESLLKEIEF